MQYKDKLFNVKTDKKKTLLFLCEYRFILDVKVGTGAKEKIGEKTSKHQFKTRRHPSKAQLFISMNRA